MELCRFIFLNLTIICKVYQNFFKDIKNSSKSLKNAPFTALLNFQSPTKHTHFSPHNTQKKIAKENKNFHFVKRRKLSTQKSLSSEWSNINTYRVVSSSSAPFLLLINIYIIFSLTFPHSLQNFQHYFICAEFLSLLCTERGVEEFSCFIFVKKIHDM